MPGFAHAVYEVARKEAMQHVRTKRLLIIAGLIVFALALVTLVFGPRLARDAGGFGVGGGSTENVLLAVFLGFLGLIFIQLLPIVLTADAVCSEWSSRTIFLLLSKPVSRTAFVLGKMLGSLITVVVTVALLLGLDYAVMQPLYSGSPSGEEVLGFVKFVAFVCVGCTALASLALFFSTVTRSTSIAILLTLGAWLVGFTILEHLGELIYAGRSHPDQGVIQGFRYVNPGYDMGVGIRFLTPALSTGDAGGVDPGAALLALLAHIVLWFGLALLIVRRRNFE
jgi:ABC-type transport system involved in multi-copper enzyme maturation permease subunit